MLQPKVPASEWQAFKKWVDAAQGDGEPFIQLTSTGSTTAGKAPPRPEANDPKALALVTDAYAAIERGEVNKAQDLLQQATKINPAQTQLWSTWGYLEYTRRDWTAAIEDYDKELASSPDTNWIYQAKAQAQFNIGKQHDAEQTLQQLVQRDPTNLKAAQMLGVLLTSHAEYAAAAKVLQPLAASNPDNAEIQLQMANLDIKSGSQDQGSQILLKIIGSLSNPNQLNNAAYMLAETGVHLDVAEQNSRRAIDMLTKQSADWTLNTELDGIRPDTRLLIASWDTLGWVLFQKYNQQHAPADLDLAESYIRASWLNNPGPETGLHLGRIEEARGNPRQALTTYLLAQASAPTLPEGVTAVPPGLTPLKTSIEALRKKGIVAEKLDAHSALQNLRILPVGKGTTGNSE